MSVLVLAAGADTVSRLPVSFGGFPNYFLCLLLHHVCLCLSGGPQSVFVLTNAPRLPVSVWRIPICSCAH